MSKPPTSSLSILSYNLRMHVAYAEAFELARQYDSDAICLQECLTGKLDEQIGGYHLACKTQKGHMGLAIYYRPDRLRLSSSVAKRLHHSLYENFHEWYWERILAATFHDLRLGQDVVIASFHATHLVASNRLRRQQVMEALDVVNEYADVSKQKLPIIVAGDYNYPLFHKKLRKVIAEQGYELFVPNKITYKNSRFHGKFDFVSTRHITDAHLTVLPQGDSDHMAVHVQAIY